MKIAAACLLVLSATLSMNAFAMSKNIARISDESIDDVTINKDFNLRASDGSVLKFLSRGSKADLSGLPPAENADTSLCDKQPEFDMFIGITQIGLDLMDKYRPLNETEIALIKRTPRCEPYISGLNMIAAVIRYNSKAPGKDMGESMKSLSVKRDKSGNYIVLKTENKRSAAFKISAGLDRVREVRDLDQLKVLASASGQNMGLRFSITDIYHPDPRQSRDWESCTYTHTERQCRYDRKERREICDYVTVTEEGTRRVISTSDQTMYTVGIEFVDMQNQVVATAEVRDLDWDIDSKYGACEPAHGRGRR